jgi:hypothetical protein
MKNVTGRIFRKHRILKDNSFLCVAAVFKQSKAFKKRQETPRRITTTTDRRTLNIGNVMLNFYFVIQDVLFISNYLYELFYSNPPYLPQGIVFESPNRHERNIIITHLQSTSGFHRDSNRIFSDRRLQCLFW